MLLWNPTPPGQKGFPIQVPWQQLVDAAQMEELQTVGGFIALAIGVLCLVLGSRSHRPRCNACSA
jgi:hypothetical protein